MDTSSRTRSPSAVSDDAWAVIAPYLTLMREDAPQRRHPLRELVNGLRFIARTGLPWRVMPHDLPPWEAVYHQTRRGLAADVFGTLIADLRVLLRLGRDRAAQPTAVILDSRTRQRTPESGGRASWDGAKKRTGSTVHLAVDTLGQLLALHVTPARDQDRRAGGELAAAVQAETGETVTLAWVDGADTGDEPRGAAAAQGIALAVVTLPEGRRGFVLRPRRWVIERSFGGMSQFRRLARDQERLVEVLEGFHLIACAMLMRKQAQPVLGLL